MKKDNQESHDWKKLYQGAHIECDLLVSRLHSEGIETHMENANFDAIISSSQIQSPLMPSPCVYVRSNDLKTAQAIAQEMNLK